jgi:hypothetical protein
LPLFAWLKDHLKVAVASLLITLLALVVAVLALVNDVWGTDGPAAAPPTSATPSPRVTTTSPAPSPTSDPTPSGSPSASPGTSTSDGPGTTSTAEVGYLDEIDDTDRNGGFRRESVNMAGVNYLRSVQFTCNGKNTYFVFPVAGFQTLTFQLGIDDATEDAFGLAADVTFYGDSGRQLGKKLTAALGPAKKVDLDIRGVNQLKIKCYGRDSRTNEHEPVPYIAFGEAVLSRGPAVS